MKNVDALKISFFNYSKRKIRSIILIFLIGIFMFLVYACSSIMVSSNNNLKETYLNYFDNNLSIGIYKIDDHNKMIKTFDKYDNIIDRSYSIVGKNHLIDFRYLQEYKQYSNTNSCLISDESYNIGDSYYINYNDNTYEFIVIGYSDVNQYDLRYFNNNIEKIKKYFVSLSVNKNNINKIIELYKSLDDFSSDYGAYKIKSYINSYNKYVIFSIVFFLASLMFSVVFLISITNFAYGTFFDDSEFFSMLRILGNSSKDERKIAIFDFSILYFIGLFISLLFIAIFDKLLRILNKNLIENIIEKEMIYNREIREPVNEFIRLWYVLPILVIILILLSLLFIRLKKKTLDVSYSSIYNGVEK